MTIAVIININSTIIIISNSSSSINAYNISALIWLCVCV